MKKKVIYKFNIVLETDFKGRKDKKPERGIALLENQSLSTLARVIIKSFGFYFDHCFGFYDNLENPYRSMEMYELFTDIPEEPKPGALGVEHVRVSRAFNKIGKELLFLFDYGDNWHFTVKLIGLELSKEDIKYPKILKRLGKAPEQYPVSEEDFEEEETKYIN